MRTTKSRCAWKRLAVQLTSIDFVGYLKLSTKSSMIFGFSLNLCSKAEMKIARGTKPSSCESRAVSSRRHSSTTSKVSRDFAWRK